MKSPFVVEEQWTPIYLDGIHWGGGGGKRYLIPGESY